MQQQRIVALPYHVPARRLPPDDPHERAQLLVVERLRAFGLVRLWAFGPGEVSRVGFDVRPEGGVVHHPRVKRREAGDAGVDGRRLKPLPFQGVAPSLHVERGDLARVLAAVSEEGRDGEETAWRLLLSKSWRQALSASVVATAQRWMALMSARSTVCPAGMRN